MIAKMKKYSFLAFHKDYDQFLHELRDLGMIHVAEKKKTTADEEQLLQFTSEHKQLTAAKKLLERYRDKKTEVPYNDPDVELGKRIPALIETIQHTKTLLLQQLQVSTKEREALQPWGNFEPENMVRLEKAGYRLCFFIAAENKYDLAWETLYNAVIIHKEGSRIYFVTITKNEHVADAINLEEVKIPDVSLASLNNLIASLQEKIRLQEVQLKDLSAELPSVTAAIKNLESGIALTRVVQSTTPVAESRLMLLQGWAPVDNVDEITRYLESKEVYFEMSDPVSGDDVPIKFKNNRFARLFEPIAELYMLPRYNEIDLTPYFAPFYMLFFGLSLGDIGYGLFLLVVATVVKIIRKDKLDGTIKAILSLVQVLGASTMIAGMLTGGFFGFAVYELDNPLSQALKEKVFFNNNRMFTLSLILGVIQILFGMCLKAANRIKQLGWVHALSTIGWILFLVSIIASVLFKERMPMFGTLHLFFIIPSLVLIFFFNSPGKNPLMNLGLGLWDTYNMATGLLGDVLSYVRLFALGLSGGILASVFNSLATGMSPDNAIAGPIVAILIFLVGHAINIFMNVLGAIVHPVRLTFVEFYKNAEFEGGGKRYIPFKN